MEALRTLITGHLPPAGEVVRTEIHPQASAPSFAGYGSLRVDSGTAALALALLSARQRRPELSAPEVIVPGYCCPDLVAAAVYAGVNVVVADIGENDAGYNLEALEACLNERTLAVIAVNFLGIQEQLEELRRRLKPGTFLIEDNAQWFPDASETDELQGDFVIFSFGRGKPVSLLGGGLLLFKTDHSAALPTPDAPSTETRIIGNLKRNLYNWLLRPQLYQWLNRNPLIKLGQTIYQPLTHVQQMAPRKVQLLPTNIDAYRAKPRISEHAYDEFISNHNQLRTLQSPRRRRLLRYPLLLKAQEARDELLARLSRAGLGATPMYQRPLWHIPGVEELVQTPYPCPNANRFADCLLTLPVHSGVTETHRQRIRTLIDTAASQGFLDAGASRH